MHWQEQGSEPDYRFSLANERTFLAWIRTSLAVSASGVVLHQFLGRAESHLFVQSLSVLLVISGALMAAGAYFRWKSNEISMRHGRALPRAFHIFFATVLVCALCVASAVLIFF